MCNDRTLIVTITLLEINKSLHAFISTHIQNSRLTSGYTDALNHPHPGDRVSNYINNGLFYPKLPIPIQIINLTYNINSTPFSNYTVLHNIKASLAYVRNLSGDKGRRNAILFKL